MRWIQLSLLAGSTIASCTEVCAQGTVFSPAAFANAAGATVSASPMTANGDFTWQQLHDGIPPMTIRRLTFRRSTVDPNRSLSRALAVDIQLILSTAPHSAGSARSRFADNHGSDRTIVLQRKRMKFLPVPWIRGVRVQPDAFFQLPLDRAFLFRGGTVCWHTDSNDHSGPGPRPYMDAVTVGVGNPGGVVAGASFPFGTSCSQGNTRSLQFGMSADKSQLTLTARGIFSGSPVPTAAMVRIGRSEMRTRSGLPLPFDLTSIGATGCLLSTSADVEVPLVRSANTVLWTIGNGLVRFPYAAFRSQAGLPLYCQAVLVARSANPLGIETTFARRMDIPSVPAQELGVQTITAALGSTSGTVFPSVQRGLIVGFSPQ